MLKKEHELLMPFVREPWKKFTFGDVKRVLKKTSESYVYGGLKKFVKLGFLREERAGNVVLYALNAGSLKTQAYAGFVAEYTAWNKRRIPYNDLQKMAEKVPTEFYIFIITGSYARNRQRADSDIDVAILIDDSSEPKRVYAELSHFCEMNIPQIHLYVFRNRDFLEMLLSNEANYGKEITRNNLVLCGGATYIKIVDEAMRHGFKG